ncbi:MAG: dephospho-CoA kinase [Dehalococcoidales bacterium]|nr:dephospho-CoA kinase [Dehalococcoidales bacterium]
MKVIALTGGIGSGKSTVANLLKELGANIIDGDKVAREILEPGTKGLQQVVAAFGKDILNADGAIDRAKFAKMVFGKPEAVARLNGITFPIFHKTVTDRLAELRQQGKTKVVVVEIPLLIAEDWTGVVDEIWVTVASEPIILKRLKDRSGYSEAESLSRIHSQMTNEERIKHADHVINTDGTLAEVKERVKKLWGELDDSE